MDKLTEILTERLKTYDVTDRQRELLCIELGKAFMLLLTGDMHKYGGGTDLDALYEQKYALVMHRADERDIPSKHQDGLIHFLDSFLDIVSDELELWEYPTCNNTGCDEIVPPGRPTCPDHDQGH